MCVANVCVRLLRKHFTSRFEKILEDLEGGEQEGGISMCELIDRYWNAGVHEGIIQGVAQGITQLLLCHGAIPEKLQERI